MKSLVRGFVFFCLFVTLSLAGYENVDNQKLQELKDSGVNIIDIRTKPEWDDTGVIQGSIKITSHTDKGLEYERFVEELKKEGIKDNFILVCRSGNRSKELGDKLAQDGFDNFYNLQKGIKVWIFEKRAVSKPMF